MSIILRLLPVILLLSASSPVLAADENAKTATVFIATFDAEGIFTGWGSGFFVDEGIVVTNKHVIEGGKYFKVFPTEGNGTVDLDCGKQISLADMKINLEDDAAYIRVFLGCAHGILRFAEADPKIGDAIDLIGYPSRSTLEESLNLSVTSGSVTGTTDDGWLTTDAYLHLGNSGGPVVSDGKVVGVAVAKGVDGEGNFIRGYFVPRSVVLNGLLYGNSSTFGYTLQDGQQNTDISGALRFGEAGSPFNPLRKSRDATSADCLLSLGIGGEAIGYGGCRCKAKYERDASGATCVPVQTGETRPVIQPNPTTPSAQQSSSSSSSSTPSKPVVRQSPLQIRTCDRVLKWFSGNQKMIDRVNARLIKRFGFVCA